MRLAIAVLLGLAGIPAGFAADTAPLASKAPVVVELFTSKYCPNCPLAEARMKGVADDNADVLVLFEHVDYWDRSPTQKDPHGLPEVTQRQYDYSNTLGERPGQVYTPMPLIDGQIMVGAPLMFTWGSALERGRALPAKTLLAPVKAKDGALNVPLPSALRDADNEIWVFGLEPVEKTKAWRVKGIAKAQLRGEKAYVTAPMLPKGEKLLVLVQKRGPGDVLAVGQL